MWISLILRIPKLLLISWKMPSMSRIFCFLKFKFRSIRLLFKMFSFSHGIIFSAWSRSSWTKTTFLPEKKQSRTAMGKRSTRLKKIAILVYYKPISFIVACLFCKSSENAMMNYSCSSLPLSLLSPTWLARKPYVLLAMSHRIRTCVLVHSISQLSWKCVANTV